MESEGFEPGSERSERPRFTVRYSPLLLAHCDELVETDDSYDAVDTVVSLGPAASD